jgi:hypothetical protein
MLVCRGQLTLLAPTSRRYPMSRALLALSCLALTLAATTVVRAQQPTPPPAAITAADVAAFLGDWTLTLDSPMGPSAMTLSVKTDAGKVGGEISSEMMPKSPIADITKAGANLVLKYSFDYQGNMVPVVITLTPSADKVGAHLSFADGAFEMAGTAAKAAAK